MISPQVLAGELIQQVADNVKALLDEYHVVQQVRARDNAFTRDAAARHSKNYMQDFSVGDTLSLHGESVVVVGLESFDGITHLVASVRPAADPDGVVKRVKCEDLREQCWGQPQWHPTLACKQIEGDFVFFEMPDTDVYHAGIVLQVNADALVVHEWIPNIKRTRWAPRYIAPGGDVKTTTKQPEGYGTATLYHSTIALLCHPTMHFDY